MTKDYLDDGELDETLNALQMWGLQMSVPREERGGSKDGWEVWHCTGEHAGQLAASVRRLQTELDRLSRIEIKYDNLCAVLNEQAAKIETLQDHIGRLLEMGWKDSDIPKVMARYKIKLEDCSFIDYSPPT
jgi:hypothetical protein